MKINETRKGKYNKIILKEKRKKQVTEKKKQNREQKKREWFKFLRLHLTRKFRLCQIGGLIGHIN
jgi:hypothetical protein